MQARSAPLHAGSARSELLAIVRAYAHGECAAFAIAAQRIFAQQGHAYKLLQFKAVDHGRTFVHAAVLIKGCLFFDAGGFVRFEDLMNRYRMGPFEDVVTSEQELMAISGCEEDDVAQALGAVQTVIALASACAHGSAAAPNQARPASGSASMPLGAEPIAAWESFFRKHRQRWPSAQASCPAQHCTPL